MAEDRNASAILDAAHELIAAAWDDEVDVAILLEELGDGGARGKELNGVFGDGGRRQRGGDDGRDGDESVGGFGAAFEDGDVAGFERERGDVGDYFGSGFEDDEEYADWAGDAREGEVRVEEGAEGGFAD